MEPTGGSPGKKHAHHDTHSKYVGPTLAETLHASEKFDKTGLLAAHLAALHDAHMLERGLLPGTSLPDSESPPIPPVYAVSPWKDLKPLRLPEMKVGKTHRRHFLEGRLCAKSLKVTSVVNVLEEASGLATKIILTNALPARASMAQAQNCYPEGARVTVRDPYLTRFPDGVVGVLVERPNDIAFLSRPESTGENGTRIYGAVEGHDNDRIAQSTSREHADFSRRIHMFEEQMKQETFHSPSHPHHLKPLREETKNSPAREAPKEKSSPAKEAPPKVVESVALQDNGASPAIDNVTSEEAPSSTTVEVQDQPTPVIPEAVVEEKELESPEVHPTPLRHDDEVMEPEVSSKELEPSQEAAQHEEGKSSVEEDTQPHEPCIETAERSGEEQQTHSTAAAEELASGKEDDIISTQVTESTSAQHKEAQLEPAHEEPQSEPAHAEPQLEPAHEEPQSELAHEEPQSEPAHEEPQLEPAHEEPQLERAHEEPQSEPAHEDPRSEPAHEEPQSAPAHEEPRSEPAHEEPQSAPAHEEPRSEPAHEEPQSAPAHEEPRSEPAHEEPQSAPAHEEPQSEPAHDESHSKPAHEEQSVPTERAKVPLIRKQFQRSDSLLAVHESEHDAKNNAGELAGEPAIVEKGSIPEREENQGSVPEIKPAVESEKVVEKHNANDLRVLGNLCFGEENYLGAADLYTRSLRLAEEEEKRQGKPVCSREIILGYSNRAEAYIRLQEYGKALVDAKKALSRDPAHLKSLFRKGRALLGLSQYEQALTTLQAAAPRAPSDRDLQAALHESTTAVQQSCHGHYDLAHYYLKGKQTGESPHCADYVGPVIVTDVGRGRGRGLVLTKDVEAGELLLVSNPIVFVPLQGVDQTRSDISQAFVNGKVQEGFRNVIEASHAQNKGLEKVGTLYDGEKALPVPSVHQTQFESASHLDAAHIRRVIQLNAINGDATMGWKNLPGSGEQDHKVEHWGLWWLPSFINHSCLPSSSPILVGSALFVFASRDLRAGDEVTRPYFDIFQPLEQRKELSAKGWGFICHCPRCKLEDALHTSLAKVTEDYVHLMELASQSKAEFGTDEKLSAMQTSAALKFFHKLDTKLKSFKLNASENNWVRSSFLHYIDMINGDHELHTHLESIVEALVTICPGSETTLHMAVVAKDSARRTFGKKSNQFKHSNQRALNICRYTYGKQRLSVLQSIVDKNEYHS